MRDLLKELVAVYAIPLDLISVAGQGPRRGVIRQAGDTHVRRDHFRFAGHPTKAL
jgi:hypothetical protein